MDKVERICPKCGTANSYDRAACQHCGASLTNLPASRQAGVPASVQGASATALVLAGSAFIARAGFKLLVRHILPRVARELAPKPASSVIVDQSPEGQPDYVIRGWRAWSVKHGEERSSGSERFEWRINRRDEGGPGRAG